jgi:hypothetical protein
VSYAVDLLQVASSSVERKHSRWALVWSASLVSLEVWATTNNIAAAGRVHRHLVAAGR